MVTKVLRKKGKKPIRFVAGGLHRSLGIPQGEKIPMSLVRKLIRAEVGETVTNPTSKGRKRIKVTTRIKRQVTLGFKGALAAGRRKVQRRRRKRKKRKK